MRSTSGSFGITLFGGVLALLFLGEIFGVSSALQAQQESSRAATLAAAEPSATTRAFMREAAGGGLAEVELGQLAQQKGTSEAVKSFGMRMVQDHGKAGEELRAIAQRKGVELPTEPPAKVRATKDRLSKLQGAAFDRAYVKEMLSDHRKDVAEFQREARKADDPDVRNWVAQTLPTIQEHLKLVEGMAASPTTGKAKP